MCWVSKISSRVSGQRAKSRISGIPALTRSFLPRQSVKCNLIWELLIKLDEPSAALKTQLLISPARICKIRPFIFSVSSLEGNRKFPGDIYEESVVAGGSGRLTGTRGENPALGALQRCCLPPPPAPGSSLGTASMLSDGDQLFTASVSPFPLPLASPAHFPPLVIFKRSLTLSGHGTLNF